MRTRDTAPRSGNDRRRPIEVGERLEIEGVGSAEIRSLTQRNWSRVAVAHTNDERYFVKQFVDRIGRWHRQGFVGDAETVARLDDRVAGVHVLPIMRRDDDRLLTVSPFIEMTTIDSLSGRNRSRDGEVARRVGAALAAILEERTSPEHPTDVEVWKGLDPKNLGLADDGTLWVFDFGPAKTLSRHDAAALAVAAGLLCRWVARPGFHLVAPERPILRGVCEPLVPMTTLAAVQLSLRQHRELRLREPQRAGLAGTAARLGIRSLGKIYWRAAEREAERLFRDQ